MKKFTKFLINLAVFLALIFPLVSMGAGLVPCETGEACNWNALMAMINGIINFILIKLTLPVAAVMFAYAGFLMVTAGGEIASARTKAKGIFFNTIIGIALVLGAYLIIKSILKIAGYNGAWIGF